MSWSFSFELLPGEAVVEDSTKRETDVIKSVYSVFLTNKRVIFRFDGMGSYLSNAFFYSDVLDARITRRLFVNYLILKTKRKDHLFNIPEPEYWSRQILSAREKIGDIGAEAKAVDAVSPEGKKKTLLDMLIVLHKNNLLTEKEFEEKVNFLDTANFK
ncbi:MAG: hypothetical protein FIA94_02715 [Nitrospirae bacterium]|nr:hypothetical protein [Nitrospirota bacterium]